MKSFTLNSLTVALAGLASSQVASAVVLVNGDFDTVPAPGVLNNVPANTIVQSQIDTGWVGTRAGWNIAGGVATRNSNDNNDTPLVQVASVPTTLTGNQLNLTFDWTPALTATGEGLNISVIVSGIIQGTDTVAPGDRAVFGGLNFQTTQTRVFGGTGASNLDLIDGMTSTGNRNTTAVVTTGVAGETTSVSIPLNFGTAGNNIEDFDFIGIRFQVSDPADGLDPGDSIGSTLDNVAFVVPEPSSALLLGFGSLAFIRRKRS